MPCRRFREPRPGGARWPFWISSVVPAVAIGFLYVSESSGIAGAGASPAAATVPTAYHAVTDRNVYLRPALPALGSAGWHFSDPTFGSRMLRVTDASTRPASPGRTFTVPSAAHQLAWNTSSDHFYVRSIDGTIIPYAFDASTMTASRIQPSPSGDGGLTILSQVEPQFSFLSPNLLFGSTQDQANDWPIVRQFDFNTSAYSDILNLGSVTTISSHTYAGALSSSATLPEKLCVLFGGTQDTNYKVAVFQAGSAGSSVIVLDTLASTISSNGAMLRINPRLGFYLHHAWMDRSGRYVLLYTVNQNPLPEYVWDLSTNFVTVVSVRAGGHDATGFGVQVNQDCCTTTTYDAAQWQFRSLGNPNVSVDLINPVLTPQEIFLADHTSWNNAQPSIQAPILSSIYRYFDGSSNTTPWRAWDGEIVAIETDQQSQPATVWRIAHHRSDVSYDGDASMAFYFWYSPNAVISPDGRWAIFTSNWEKTLGSAAGSDSQPGGRYRCDVFLVELGRAFTDDPIVAGVTTIKALHITELRTRIDAVRARYGLAPYGYADVTIDGRSSLIRAVDVSELRTALADAYMAANRPLPTYADPGLTAGVMVKAVHISELRTALVAIE